MTALSLAEMKLELIRAIDRMAEEELKSVQQLVEGIQGRTPPPSPKRKPST